MDVYCTEAGRSRGRLGTRGSEKEFKGFSYGFRPKRSQHKALDALYIGLMRKRVSWVLDADIRGFFDTIDHEWMMKFLGHRINDKRLCKDGSCRADSPSFLRRRC